MYRLCIKFLILYIITDSQYLRHRWKSDLFSWLSAVTIKQIKQIKLMKQNLELLMQYCQTWALDSRPQIHRDYSFKKKKDPADTISFHSSH